MRNHNKGFIALMTVLLVLVIVLTVGLNLSSLSIGEAKMGLQNNQSSQAYYLANLCAEQALMRLKENSSYHGDESIAIENGSCTILPIEDRWVIKVSGSFFNQVKKMKIVVSKLHPKLIINSWQEVADF